jgi:hypothetical protein
MQVSIFYRLILFFSAKVLDKINNSIHKLISISTCLSWRAELWVTQVIENRSPFEREWPTVLGLLLSTKRRTQLKTCKTLEREKSWSWVPTGLETKDDHTDEGQQYLLDYTEHFCDVTTRVTTVNWASQMSSIRPERAVVIEVHSWKSKRQSHRRFVWMAFNLWSLDS